MQLASNLDSDPAKAKESMPGRKLQQSIGKYHNADLQERLQLITRAEETSEQLLAAADIDGDALGRLVCRCAGWLMLHCFLNLDMQLIQRQNQLEMLQVLLRTPICNHA